MGADPVGVTPDQTLKITGSGSDRQEKTGSGFFYFVNFGSLFCKYRFSILYKNIIGVVDVKKTKPTAQKGITLNNRSIIVYILFLLLYL